MKTVFKHTLVIGIVAAIFITACKKEDTTTPGTVAINSNTSAEYVRCKIDGASWSASQPKGKDTAYSFSSNGKAYMIENMNGAVANQFNFAIFPFNDSVWALESATFISSGFELYDNNFAMTGLQLNITRDSVSRIITGTYSFPLLNVSDNLDTIKITNGEFRVKY